MASRQIDGDQIAKSEAVLSLPERYRPEYAYLLTLANHRGVFQADARKVWASYYSYNRTEYPNISDVEAVLAAFEEHKLLYRFKDRNGTLWGYFTNIDGALVIPPPSTWHKFAEHGEPVPEGEPFSEKLRNFLGEKYAPASNKNWSGPGPEAGKSNSSLGLDHSQSMGEHGLGLGLGSGNELKNPPLPLPRKAREGQSQEKAWDEKRDAVMWLNYSGRKVLLVVKGAKHRRLWTQAQREALHGSTDQELTAWLRRKGFKIQVYGEDQEGFAELLWSSQEGTEKLQWITAGS